MTRAIGAPSTAVTETLDSPAPRSMFPAWPAVGLAALVVVRAAVYVTALLMAPSVSDPNRIIPVWAQLFEALLFASRAISRYFAFLAGLTGELGRWECSSWTRLAHWPEPYIRYIRSRLLSSSRRFSHPVTLNAFQACDALVFLPPANPRARLGHKALGVWFRGFTVAAFLLGASLALLNVYAALTPTDTASMSGRMADATRRDKTRICRLGLCAGSSCCYFR